MHRVEGILGFGVHLDERSDLVRFYVSRSLLGKLHKWSNAFFSEKNLKNIFRCRIFFQKFGKISRIYTPVFFFFQFCGVAQVVMVQKYI
jgi:hypothetical protein